MSRRSQFADREAKEDAAGDQRTVAELLTRSGPWLDEHASASPGDIVRAMEAASRTRDDCV